MCGRARSLVTACGIPAPVRLVNHRVANIGQTTGQSSNDAPVKADIKVELVNTNTDKAIKAVGDSISIGKTVAKKHKKATVNFLKQALLAAIGIISFLFFFALVVFVF